MSMSDTNGLKGPDILKQYLLFNQIFKQAMFINESLTPTHVYINAPCIAPILKCKLNFFQGSITLPSAHYVPGILWWPSPAHPVSLYTDKMTT